MKTTYIPFAFCKSFFFPPLKKDKKEPLKLEKLLHIKKINIHIYI